MLEVQPSAEKRSPERLRVHYEIERRLADRLRNADKDERGRLYGEVYDELFRSVPDHPQFTGGIGTDHRFASVARQIALLEPFLSETTTFLELGAGDCALAFEVAKRAQKSYGLDVSAEIAKVDVAPENFSLLLTNGSNVPLPSQSVDVAYSNQLMEHLHPEDALDQLREIFRVLRPNGIYVCVTPNRLSGPHDISRYFDDVACGFHLREYSAEELQTLFHSAGFAELTVLVGRGGRTIPVPAARFALGERLLSALPRKLRRKIAHHPLMTGILGIKLLAKKAGPARRSAPALQG